MDHNCIYSVSSLMWYCTCTNENGFGFDPTYPKIRFRMGSHDYLEVVIDPQYYLVRLSNTNVGFI